MKHWAKKTSFCNNQLQKQKKRLRRKRKTLMTKKRKSLLLNSNKSKKIKMLLMMSRSKKWLNLSKHLRLKLQRNNQQLISSSKRRTNSILNITTNFLKLSKNLREQTMKPAKNCKIWKARLLLWNTSFQLWLIQTKDLEYLLLHSTKSKLKILSKLT